MPEPNPSAKLDAIRSHTAMGAEDALALSRLIRPLLAGRDPQLVLGALADLVSIGIAGHVVPGDPQATARLRGTILGLHVAYLIDLIPASAGEILGETGLPVDLAPLRLAIA